MMPHGFVAALHDGLRGVAEVLDETEFLDGCKARKSLEEMVQIRHTAATQDAVFAKLLGFVRPGLRDFEVNAFIDHELQLLGAERGTYIGRSAAPGTAVDLRLPAPAGPHDRVRATTSPCCWRAMGLGGQWTELGRTLCFGRAGAELLEGFEVCREAQAETARRCKPGDAGGGYRPGARRVHAGAWRGARELRLYAHGMGYDMVERPLIREDETMTLEPGCSLAIHPTHPTRSMLAHICDNVLIGLDGQGSSSSMRRPSEVFEL